MNFEFKGDELQLLTVLLDKELGETRLEIRHAQNAHFKEHLKEREEILRTMLEKVAPGFEAKVPSTN